MKIFMFNEVKCWSIFHEFNKLTNKRSWHKLNATEYLKYSLQK